jgi:4-hydroxy-tetrahydrodipicolinate reductase
MASDADTHLSGSGLPGAGGGSPAARVVVTGAAGRMGTAVCAAVAGAPDVDLVGAVDPGAAGVALAEATGVEGTGLSVVGDLATALGSAAGDGPLVVVDFSVIEAARATVARCAAEGVHVVVGTTGWTGADLEEIQEAFPADGTVGCVLAPNFAIGAVVMVRLAAAAARWFETAEIIELHHDAKRDAPSGTAMHTAEAMERGRRAAGVGPWAGDPTTDLRLPGARGGTGPGGIHMHSVRLRGLVAHEEILLGTTGQTLSIRHDSYDRTSFMPGVLLAVRAVAGRPGLTLGLDPLLGF